MKFLYTGAGILLACLLLCIIVTSTLNRYTEEAVSQIEQARQLGEAGEYEEAADCIEKATVRWEERMNFFGIALPHEHLDKVDEAFQKTQAYARIKNSSEFGPNCITLIEDIRSLAEIETPKFYNVF